jgi:hypothetical protein
MVYLWPCEVSLATIVTLLPACIGTKPNTQEVNIGSVYIHSHLRTLPTEDLPSLVLLFSAAMMIVMFVHELCWLVNSATCPTVVYFCTAKINLFLP